MQRNCSSPGGTAIRRRNVEADWDGCLLSIIVQHKFTLKFEFIAVPKLPLNLIKTDIEVLPFGANMRNEMKVIVWHTQLNRQIVRRFVSFFKENLVSAG